MKDQPLTSPFGEVHIETSDAEEAFAQLVGLAYRLHASDLYILTDEREVAVFVRHLGIIKPVTVFDRTVGKRIINYLKAIAEMDLVQTQHPQDGRLVYAVDEEASIDLRINTIPTLYGEDMSLRLLSRELALLGLDNLGLRRSDLANLKGLLNSPGGLLLVTGPSGAGKTTTLYASLNYLHNGSRKINTIEDPVEYAIRGIRQSAVNPHVKLDFPEVLRSVLRQSPDVIMVGEIRDPVTAETAVRAANTGHLVLATLHAPVAAAAVDSILALGVHPHFLSTCLLGVLTQRLVRTLCLECRTAFDISDSPHTFDDIRDHLEGEQGQYIYSAPGCSACYQNGYSGRTAVFEVLRSSREIRRLIAEGATVRQIRDAAVAEGMLDMRRSALLKVAEGITSTEEVIRVIPTEHLDPEA